MATFIVDVEAMQRTFMHCCRKIRLLLYAIYIFLYRTKITTLSSRYDDIKIITIFYRMSRGYTAIALVRCRYYVHSFPCIHLHDSTQIDIDIHIQTWGNHDH